MEILTLDKSVEASIPLREMSLLSLQLDAEYLKEALKQMKEAHSFRDAAAILNPNPFTHNQQQDLNAAKMKQLDLFLQLAENTKNIMKCTQALATANQNSSQLNQFFGL